MSQAEMITFAFNDLLKNLKISGDSLTNISIETTRTKDGDETMKIVGYPCGNVILAAEYLT